jgi:hypothetical protein
LEVFEMRYSPLFALALLLSFSTLSFAYEKPAVKKGDSEVSMYLSGQTLSANGSTFGTTQATGTYGYFHTDKLEVGLSMTLLGMQNSKNTINTSMLSPFAKYHVKESSSDPNMVPYFGGAVLLGNMDFTGGSSSVVGAEVLGGADFFLKKEVAIGVEAAISLFQYSGVAGSAFSIRVPFKIYF